MADPTRDGFEALRRTKPYQEWAASSSGATIDAGKLDRKLAGEPAPRPRSGYALALWRMLDALKPPDPPPSPLAPVFERDTVMNVGLSAFHDPGRTLARELGWTAVCPEILHGANPGANIAELKLIGPGLRARGWALGGWGTYGQGSNPHTDGERAAMLARELRLDFFYGNGEAWAEGADAWKSRAFLDGWRAGGAPCPIGCSCLGSDTTIPRNFDYAAWLEVPGAAIAPQVYGNVDAGYTWQASLAMLLNAGVPKSRISMTFGTYVDDVARLPIPYSSYRTWMGPRGAYVGERMPAGGWAKMERAA